MTGRSDPGSCSRRGVVDHRVGYAVGDEVDPLLGDPLIVDRGRQPERIQPIVPDRHVRAHDLLAEIHE